MVVERKKSVPLPAFFGLFRSTTGPFKGFKKSRWNIVQLRSWPDLTRGLNGTIGNFFPGTRKPVSSTGQNFARPVWVFLKSRSCLSPYQRAGLSNHGFVSTIRTLKLNGLQKRSNGKYAFAQQRYSNYDDQNNSQYWFLLKS